MCYNEMDYGYLCVFLRFFVFVKGSIIMETPERRRPVQHTQSTARRQTYPGQQTPGRRPTHKRRRRRNPLGALLLIAVIVVAIILLFPTEKRKCDRNLYESVSVEAATGQLTAQAFLIDPSLEMTVSLQDSGNVDLQKTGAYTVTLLCNEYTFERTVYVVDTTAPRATVKAVTFFREPAPKPEDFIAEIQDASPVSVRFVNQPELTREGLQTVTLELTDDSGNTARVDATLTVVIDTQAPVISGVKNKVVYKGDSVAYRSGVTVKDDWDEAPTLTIDSSQVDLDKLGTYKVVYTATDASGNTATAEATVTVAQKQSTYVDVETIYEKADSLLKSIVKDSMTKREQVVAVYKWVNKNVRYADHSDKSDWMQGAYQAMTKRSGDCFNYFALTKLFLERLGIDNIDVVKVKNYAGDSMHYWSLVSLDEGKTWYHLDATPRVGSGDNFCLVTDAFMDAYSAQHNNCFNRDKSLYPATPKE